MPGPMQLFDLAQLWEALKGDLAAGRDAFVGNMDRAMGRAPLAEGETDSGSQARGGMALAGAAMTGSMPMSVPAGAFTAGAARRAAKGQTVKDPSRVAFPGIYQNPKTIVAQAAERVEPEDPLLRKLFGVDREDLFSLAQRSGNEDPKLAFKEQARGSTASERLMNPRNEQRMLDVLGEADKTPLRHMRGWYVMDPAYAHFKKQHGEAAPEAYKRMNTLMGMASPGSEVMDEIVRGSAANYLQGQNRWPDFIKYGGKASADRPADIAHVPGHPYHRTSQALPMQNYLRSGRVEMQSPKVPTYIQASGVPETGFQTRFAVPDAHWSRAVGLADARTAPETYKQSASFAEAASLWPWWKERIANRAGMEPVPAQALAWGAFAPQTGVTTAVGAPKLELIAKQIGAAAERLGITPEEARDLWVRNEIALGGNRPFNLFDAK